MKALKFNLIIMAALLVANANGQTKREILVEDPKMAPNLRFDITPLNITSQINESISGVEYGVRGSYRMNNRFLVSAEYRHELSDMTEAGYGYTSGAQEGSAIEASATYYFSVKEKEKEGWLPIKSRSIGNNTVEVTVDPLNYSKLVMYGVRGGVLNIRNTGSVYDAEFTKVSGPAPQPLPGYDDAVSMQTSNMVFVGLSNMRIRNLKVKYPVYGTRRRQNIREWYLDGIYALSHNLSNVKYKDEAGLESEFSITSKEPLPQLGARIGFFNTGTGRAINFGWGMEMGWMPRAAYSNFYYNVRIAIPLAFNLNKAE